MSTGKFKIESGVQLLARLSKKPEIKKFHQILFKDGLKQGNVVEVIGNDSSTSYLLIDLICEALVPNNNTESVGVLMFNTTGHFNYQEFIDILQKRIYYQLNNYLDPVHCKVESERVLHRALNNFFLLEIYDATQLYTTIHGLDNIFMKHSNISLLLFETLTAFYWSEQGFKITKMDLYIKNLLGMIQKVSKEYKVILIYTRPTYFSSSKGTDDIELSEIPNNLDIMVQLVEHSKEIYQLNIKTSDSYYSKYLHYLDGIIKWK